VDRYRPYVYNPEVSFDHKQKKDSKSSFFSGHTTLAFASSVFLATTFQELHPDSKFTALVWTGSLITAATVGILRIESGKHFPTDVLTGAVVGSFVGYLVPHFHKNKKDNSSQIDRIEHIPILVIRFKF
jgi:membrane-associated phospholipid phosphatase